MLRITKRTVRDVIILDVRGAIAKGAATETVRDAVQDALSRGGRRLVVDLTEATSSDATGVSALLDAKLLALAWGAEIALTGLRGIDDLLITVALRRYFDVFDCNKDALAAFGFAARTTGDAHAWDAPAHAA
jgi:anti-anti-sigma regulatory factor